MRLLQVPLPQVPLPQVPLLPLLPPSQMPLPLPQVPLQVPLLLPRVPPVDSVSPLGTVGTGRREAGYLCRSHLFLRLGERLLHRSQLAQLLLMLLR